MELPQQLAIPVSSICAGWRSKPAWAVLDLAFSSTASFTQLWRHWKEDPLRPRMLHVVALCSDVQALRDAPPASEEANALAKVLSTFDFAGKSTFHRIWLSEGQVCLTLCASPTMLALSELGSQFDCIYASQLPMDPWLPKLLARRCQRGTRIAISSTCALDVNAWTSLGFKTIAHGSPPLDQFSQPKPNQTPNYLLTFDPDWHIKLTRSHAVATHKGAGRCTVVGAGLAGATVAHALALRGWQVQVYEQASEAAAGASGLPVGLIAPHRSKHDDLQSQLSRSGVRLMLDLARRYLREGQEWGGTGILELARDPAQRASENNNHWHALGAWIKPAELVKALLQHPKISLIGNTHFKRIVPEGLNWKAHTATEAIAIHADALVLTNAVGFESLFKSSTSETDLPQRAGLHRVFGTVSHGTYANTGNSLLEQQPEHPVNGNGSYIPNIPTPGGSQWFTGATFTTDPVLACDLAAQHQANFERLNALLPETASQLQQDFEKGEVSHWSGERCVTQDRLPLVGQVDPVNLPSLWCSVGMGSKGLSLSALCAELLVARLTGEPLPIEIRLAKTLDVARYAPHPLRQAN